MDTSLFTAQRKKLVLIGLFLLAVVAVVGREENPGMLQQIATEAEGKPVAAGPAQQSVAPVPTPVAQPSRQAQQAPDLDSWYSEAGRQDAPVEPFPEDKGWLVNDAEPLVSAEPIS